MTVIVVSEVERQRVVKVYDTANSICQKGPVASITRSGTTATVTRANHGYTTGQTVTISGADQAAYNGDFTITVTDANTFTYTVAGSPVTPATGNIYVADIGQSQWMNAPKFIQIGPIAGGTTCKLEVAVSRSAPWQQLGSDLTNADDYKILPVGSYNFARIRRSGGTGSVVALAQF